MNIFIDGTWNTPKDETNIHRLYLRYGGAYFPGPGTDSFFLERIFGGAFGAGTDAIVDEAYHHILTRHNPGIEPLHIFGFSRGAAAARMLAAKVCKLGGGVDFLGCFDTVGAFGIPVNILGIPFQKINLFKDMNVHPNVKRAAHALASDEKRSAFVHTKMEPRKGIVQVYFPGDHGAIGNGAETFRWMKKQFDKARNAA